jgi:hypothetical protein
VILRAVRKEERVHAVEIGKERRSGASVFGSGECLTIGLRVVPGAAQIRVCVEDIA